MELLAVEYNWVRMFGVRVRVTARVSAGIKIRIGACNFATQVVSFVGWCCICVRCVAAKK